MASVQAEVQDLRRKLHERGYDTRQTGSGHFAVYKTNGSPLTTSKGQPITIPSTPSQGALNRTIATLRDLGALPKLADQTRLNKMRARRDEKLNKSQLKEKTRILRAEMEQVMVDYSLKQADIYHFADWYASQHGIPVPANPQGIVSKLHKGQASMMNEPYRWLRSAIDAIKAAEGKIPKADEIRAMNGKPQEARPEPEESGVGVKVEDRTAVHVATSPKLAIEAMRWIYAEVKDDDRIEQLINEIAKVELRP